MTCVYIKERENFPVGDSRRIMVGMFPSVPAGEVEAASGVSAACGNAEGIASTRSAAGVVAPSWK